MKVMKFGGSSLENAERITRAAEIIAASSKKGGIAVVLSALKGVTDALIECASLAEKGARLYHDRLEELRRRHLAVLSRLFPGRKGTLLGQRAAELEGTLATMFAELGAVLHSVELIQESPPSSRDLILSFGERMSSLLVSAYLQTRGLPAELIDAREIIITKNDTIPVVVLPVSFEKIEKRLASASGIAVIPGFIASNERGVTTTLGRDGSDYTASLIAAGIGAELIEIWTDVDGVMSADPRVVAESFTLPSLTYEEAMELSYFGAKVIHPYTMIPAVKAGIPIRIKNTMNPEAPGTLVAAEVSRHATSITGMASIPDIALMNVQGGGMIGVTGIAARIFGALARTRVNIIMISQASSEHSICLAFRQSEAAAVGEALREELALELQNGIIQDFEILRDLVIVAVIGENMRGTPGISGRLFSALGEEKVNVLAIAQGSSERNISFVIHSEDADRALACIHGAFLSRKEKER